MVSGVIIFSKRETFYATLGGRGTYLIDPSNTGENKNYGGYNGGGSALLSKHGDSSGGCSSDIRFLENDLFHRVLVAWAG